MRESRDVGLGKGGSSNWEYLGEVCTYYLPTRYLLLELVGTGEWEGEGQGERVKISTCRRGYKVQGTSY